MRSATCSTGRLAALLAALTLALPCLAQPPLDDPEATVVEDLIVRGTVPGPAWWAVSDGDSIVYVLGAPAVLPRGLNWDDQVLRRRLDASRRLILPPNTELRFPEGQDFMGSLPADLRARFGKALADRGIPSVMVAKTRPAAAALTLLARHYESPRLTARQPFARIEEMAALMRVRPERPAILGHALGEGDRGQEMACLRRTVDKVEEGPERDREAGRAWAIGDVRAALDADRVYDQCLLTLRGGAALFRALHEAEAEAIAQALTGEGSAVAVMPLRSLVVAGGVLERLRARGFTVEGPDLDVEVVMTPTVETADIAPETGEDATTVSDLVVSAPEEAPIPEVGEPAPIYTVADLLEFEKTMFRVRFSCGPDALKLYQRTVEARTATEAAEKLRRDAARGSRSPAEAEAGELARQTAVNAFLDARSVYEMPGRPRILAINQADRHTVDERTWVYENFNAPLSGHRYPPVPPQFADLGLERLAAVSMDDEKGRFLRITGVIRNPRASGIPTPPLAFSALDRAGLPLRTVIADPGARLLGHRIGPGQIQAFSYDFRRPPGATRNVMVTFGSDSNPSTGEVCGQTPGGAGRKRSPSRIAPMLGATGLPPTMAD